jgi:hypothetical protein
MLSSSPIVTSTPRKPGLGFRPTASWIARRRLVGAASVCAVVGLVAASVANRQRIALRCIDGQLIAYRGRPLPAGEKPLDPDRFPPLPAKDLACRDQPFSSIEELEARYLTITLSQVDDAIASAQSEQLESAANTVDRLGDRPELEEFMGKRRRAVLVSLLESDLDEAAAVLGRLRTRLRAAKAAGVSPTVVRALESQLEQMLRDASTRPPEEPAADTDDAEEPESTSTPALPERSL